MAQEANIHDDTNNSVFKIAMNLTVTCFISGVIIAGTYAITEPSAHQQRIKAKNDAMQELVKGAQSFEAVTGKDGWYAGMKDGRIAAYIVPASGKGYAGNIDMLVAVTPDGKSMDFKVIKHSETPGLGDKMLDAKFRRQFSDKASNDLSVVKVPTDTNIQALTGATITSRAVTKGVREAVEQVAAYSAGQKK